jgi:cytochrome c553
MRQRLPRVEDGRHLEFIRSLPCVCCGNDIETQAAHLRSVKREYGKDFTGGGRKPSDMWALPVCGRCHQAQHMVNEESFWKCKGINPFVLALSLFAASGNHELAQEVISAQVPR